MKNRGWGLLWLTRNPIRISGLLALSFEGSESRESKNLSCYLMKHVYRKLPSGAIDSGYLLMSSFASSRFNNG